MNSALAVALLLIVALSLPMTALAAKKKSKSHKSKARTSQMIPAAKSGSKLGTNFDFDDLIVRGKYQYADEALATVENEKDLDDLLGVRKHFKDRMKQASNRR
jgi:hypothetical protein